jgi:uncharacterized protein (DUF488 family)
MTLYTMGHGARAPDEFVAVARTGNVERVIDVRRYPGSRRHPHFGRDALEQWLPAAGVAYEWWGDALGGRRRAGPIDATRHPAWREEAFRAYAEYMDTDEFRDAFVALDSAAAQRRSAVMCSETLWWRCHRRLIADAAVLRDLDVVHLGVGRAPAPHVPSPWMRAGDDGWPVYDVGVESPLFDERD